MTAKKVKTFTMRFRREEERAVSARARKRDMMKKHGASIYIDLIYVLVVHLHDGETRYVCIL